MMNNLPLADYSSNFAQNQQLFRAAHEVWLIRPISGKMALLHGRFPAFAANNDILFIVTLYHKMTIYQPIGWNVPKVSRGLHPEQSHFGSVRMRMRKF
jgi:hypothetical protein